jgi:hypothetical protein
MQPKQPDEMPEAMAESIAFAIAGSAVTRDTQQKHIALAYRADNSKVMLLHLGWHQALYHHEWHGKYQWLEVRGLDRELQETFADWAVLVAEASPGTPIPYSIIFHPGQNFDVRGHFINQNDGSGLTCATFLLALFSDYNLPLIDIDSWPESRNGDLKWVRKILKKLRDEVLYNRLPPWAWIEQAKRRHMLKRFRPEEVFVTAAMYSGEPLKFSVVESAGYKINALITA